MNGLSVVIPSKTASNLIPCIEAIRRHEPAMRIFVIDDGLPDRSVIDAITIDGQKPFIFARNVNIGIQAAGTDDVILLNDDALLETPGGFTLMQQTAAEHPEFGLISATTNLAGNPQQQPQRPPYPALAHCPRECRKMPGHSAPVVAFVCVLIPRRTIQRLAEYDAYVFTDCNDQGLLDERFTAYGWEDNDYCRRLTIAGLKIGIFDGCFVDHSKLRSTFRGDPKAGGDIDTGREIYLEKWGTM